METVIKHYGADNIVRSVDSIYWDMSEDDFKLTEAIIFDCEGDYGTENRNIKDRKLIWHAVVTEAARILRVYERQKADHEIASDSPLFAIYMNDKGLLVTAEISYDPLDKLGGLRCLD